jgi:hypothetical protein
MGSRLVAWSCVLALGAGACVDPFSGSNVQIDFSAATQTATATGGAPAANQPPADTYDTLYAVQLEKDGSGTVTQADLFEVQRFEVRHEIDPSSPCFIDLENARFPGLHVTEYANKVMEQTGITDPLNPPAGAPAGDVTDVLDANVRMSHLGGLASSLKVVTSFSTFQYGPSAAPNDCIETDPGVDQTLFPPPECTGDASNALRLELCRAAWASDAGKSYYEGSDKVYTLPLNGKLFGMVDGANPVNGVTVGGSQMFVDEVLDAFDGFTVNWQYKDLDGDGQPDYPAGTADADKSNIGYTYMTGTPVRAARGVINVFMTNPNDPAISAQMAIFPDLADDGLHF